MLKTIGKLRGTTNVEVGEMTLIFLHILAHDVKNKVIRRILHVQEKQLVDTLI